MSWSWPLLDRVGVFEAGVWGHVEKGKGVFYVKFKTADGKEDLCRSRVSIARAARTAAKKLHIDVSKIPDEVI